MKVSGNFACGKCPTIIYNEFDIDESKLDDKNYLMNSIFVKCPVCGTKASDDIPNTLLVVAKALVSRGYIVKMCFEKTLGIAFTPQLRIDDFDESKLELPKEFNLDLTEDDMNIIANARMQADDFEGIDKEQYINEALINLLKFAKSLPKIKDGKYIKLVEKEK